MTSLQQIALGLVGGFILAIVALTFLTGHNPRPAPAIDPTTTIEMEYSR